MHYYASDSPFRGAHAYFWLAALSVLVAYGIAQAVVAFEFEPKWWLEVPSALGCFGLVVLVYEKSAWRYLSPIPDFNGTWIGDLRSSFGDSVPTHCVARIKQSWLRISVELETASSISHSCMAALFEDAGPENGLKYEYRCEPKALSAATMHIHRGTAHLNLNSAPNSVGGDYYTGRGRETYGQIRLRRISSKRLSFDDAMKETV